MVHISPRAAARSLVSPEIAGFLSYHRWLPGWFHAADWIPEGEASLVMASRYVEPAQQDLKVQWCNP